MGRAGEKTQKWHCDIPVLAPDGGRVAYLQSDSPVPRIVVVNLDRPDLTSSLNLGEMGNEPLDLVWRTTEKIEVRRGTATVAVIDADPEPATSTATMEGHVSVTPLQPVDQSALQLLFQTKLPHRSIHVLNWDDAGRRVLLLAEATNDPGRFFVYDRLLDLLFEVARRKISISER